jgi:hypothetical protein
MNKHHSTLFVLIGLYFCVRGSMAAAAFNLEVEIVNRSASTLTDTQIHFGKDRCEWGVVVKNGRKVYGSYQDPIPSRAEFHCEVNGQHRVEYLDLKNVYPSRRSGRLTFTVYDDRVEPSFLERGKERSSPPR